MEGSIDVEKTIGLLERWRRFSERVACEEYWKCYWRGDTAGCEQVRELYGEYLEAGLEKRKLV
jgi:hypothetical protein